MKKTNERLRRMKTKSITLDWTIEIPTTPGNYLVRYDGGKIAIVPVRNEEGEMQWSTGTGHWYPIVKDEKQEWAGPIV